MLVGYEINNIVQGSKDILNIFYNKQYIDKPLYGDGHTGEKIIKILQEQI
jgi:UDP-N-acetylglucosamine 2-epimerase